MNLKSHLFYHLLLDNHKLGIASMAQINQLGVPANVTADNTTTLNVTIKGKDGSEQTIHEVIELPDKNKH